VVVVPRIESTVVVRGDSLWRISRTAYGRGARYSVIYAANRDQIRNPNLIYPGQIFVLPQADQ
jgi:nucleoid-associated protein YgaU